MSTVKGECARCGESLSRAVDTLCPPCSLVANKVIVRWMDGGDAPASEIREMFGISAKAFDQRCVRLRRAKIVRPAPEWTVLRGESNPGSKLTDAQCAEIRAAFVPGVTKAELARRYNCAESTVRSILSGQRRALPSEAA